MAKLVPAKKLSFVTEGTLVFAHETRSFTPSGSPVSYWVVDKTGKLSEYYDRLTGGVKNGTPVYAELEVVDMGKSDEGFAKSYESVYQVVRINGLSLSKGDEAVVSEDRVWSKLLNDSVSLSGVVRTDAVDGSGSSIHVIFSPDSLKAELFISGQKESAVLTASGPSASAARFSSASIRTGLEPVFKVKIFDLKDTSSVLLTSIIYPSGNLSGLFLTAWFISLVSTPYRVATLLSRMTFCPRSSMMNSSTLLNFTISDMLF